MNQGFRNILVRLFTVIVIVFVCCHSVYSQMDSITYSSTCSNYKIHFGSTLFSTIEFPDKVFWKFGDPGSGFYDSAATQLPTHLYSAPGNYLVSLTVILGGDTTKMQGTIRVVDPVSFNFGPDIFLCEKGDTSIAGPVIPGATYLWNDEDSTKTNILPVTKTGVYTLQIDGCSVTDSIGVFFSEKPEIKLGDDHTLCTGEILSLNASTQNGNYSWTLNGVVLPDTTGQLPVISPGGQYIAKVSVPGCGVFSDTATITFGSLAAPSFSLGPDTLLCPKQIYPLTASVAGATAYRWSTGAADSMINIADPAIYWVFVTVSGQCEVVDSVEAKYRGDKNLDFHDTAICKGSTLVLNADFGTGIYNWTSDPPQRNDQNQTGQSTYFVYEPGLYSVVASVGNCVYTDSLRVSFNDSLMLDIGRDTSLCIGEEYLLHVKTNANNFIWQDGSTAGTFLINTAGTFTVIGENGCGKDTASVKIETRHCECELLLPNAFTPNGDGNNETFRPLHPCKMTNFNLRIYNRYGEPVFQTTDQFKGWDGTYNMEKASEGTYVWTASYINSDTQQRIIRKGFVILIR